MNRRMLVGILLIIVAISVAGCKKKSQPGFPEPIGTTAGPSEPFPSEITQTVDPSIAELDELTRKFQPVFFDFNRFEIRQDQVPVIQNNAGVLRQYPNVNVILEGHCDERGTEEYNLALGEKRARVVKEYLVNLGIAPTRIETISYGEERPFAFGQNEASWAQNRRAQSVVLKVQ